jgi:hypothetical protein
MIPGTRASLMEQLELVHDRQVIISNAWLEKLHVFKIADGRASERDDDGRIRTSC